MAAMYSLFAGHSVASPSTSVVNYAPVCMTDNLAWSSSEGNTQKNILPEGGNAFRLMIWTDSAPGAGTGYTITIRKNGADTTLAATIQDSNTFAQDVAHTATFVATDVISLSATPIGTPASVGWVYWSLIYQDTDSNSQVILGNSRSGNLVVSSSTGQVPLFPGANNATSGRAQTVMPAAGTISKLYVNLSTAPAAATSVAFTMRKNAAGQTVTCSIDSSHTSANDTAHSFSVADADQIDISAAATGATGNKSGTWSCIFTPTTFGQTFIGKTIGSAQSTTATQYIDSSGGTSNTGWGTTEAAAATHLGPFRFTKIRTHTDITGTGSYTWTLRKNSAATGLSVSHTGNTLTASTSSTVDFAQNDTIDLQDVPASPQFSQTGQGFSFLLDLFITTTQTQLGVSRITIKTTQTITGKSKINMISTQTQTGKSRITASTQQTQLGKASIKAPVTQTITGRARIQITSTQTIAGLSRITIVTQQTIQGRARITATTAQTQAGKSRITITTQQTLQGKSRVTATTPQTILGKGDIKLTTLQTILGKSSITIITTQTIAGKSRITAATQQTQTGKARVTATTKQTTTGLSRITITTLQTIAGRARITDTALQTIQGKSRITATTQQTIAGKSRVTATTLQIQQGKSRITITSQATITGHARVTAAALQTQLGRSRITITTTQIQLGRSRLTITTLQTITGRAAIKHVINPTKPIVLEAIPNIGDLYSSPTSTPVLEVDRLNTVIL